MRPCIAESPDGHRCSLHAGHAGDHKSASGWVTWESIRVTERQARGGPGWWALVIALLAALVVAGIAAAQEVPEPGPATHPWVEALVERYSCDRSRAWVVPCLLGGSERCLRTGGIDLRHPCNPGVSSEASCAARYGLPATGRRWETAAGAPDHGIGGTARLCQAAEAGLLGPGVCPTDRAQLRQTDSDMTRLYCPSRGVMAYQLLDDILHPRRPAISAPASVPAGSDLVVHATHCAPCEWSITVRRQACHSGGPWWELVCDLDAIAETIDTSSEVLTWRVPPDRWVEGESSDVISVVATGPSGLVSQPASVDITPGVAPIAPPDEGPPEEPTTLERIRELAEEILSLTEEER